MRERRAAIRLLPDTLQPDGGLLAAGELERDRRAEPQVMVLDVLLASEEAVVAEPAGGAVVALRPVHGHAVVQVGLHTGDVAVFAQVAGTTGADGGDVADPRLAGQRLARLRLDRGERVRGGDRVVGDEQLVDCALERAAQACTEDGHEGDERQADHQG